MLPQLGRPVRYVSAGSMRAGVLFSPACCALHPSQILRFAGFLFRSTGNVRYARVASAVSCVPRLRDDQELEFRLAIQQPADEQGETQPLR